MSAFQRKRTTVTLPGTRQSLQNGQLLLSSGNSSLDAIFSGGLPIGSVLLIEEDKFVTYSKALARYFLAEGTVHKHELFVVNLDDDPQEFIKTIPQPCIVDTSKPASVRNPISIGPADSYNSETDDMRIAWRYNALPKVDAEQRSGNQEHHFDLTKHMTAETLAEQKITLFNEDDSDASATPDNVFHNKVYGRILIALKTYIAKQLADPEKPKNVLRISITSLGSPLWYESNFSQDLCLFLTLLKAIVRHAPAAVCCLTMPVHLLRHHDNQLIHRVRNLVDFDVELESFAGSDRETNPIFKEYHGLLYLRKIGALNTLAATVPETHDLAFKLRRRQFVIEKLHLPPELQEPAGPGDEIVPSLSCGSTTKSLLEF